MVRSWTQRNYLPTLAKCGRVKMGAMERLRDGERRERCCNLGFIGGAIRSLSGDPAISVQRKTKNKALQKEIDAGISDFSAFKEAGQGALSDYISKYMAGEGAAATRTGQEIGAVDKFYSGATANDLAALRARRSGAVTTAANRASNYALANLNRSRLNNEGGSSSYDARVLGRNVGDIQVQAALDDTNQERADYGYVTGSQLALAGERNKMASSQASYGLVPEAARAQFYQRDIGVLGGLGQLDQMNKFYGLKQESNPWADFADSADQGIMNGVSIASSVSSMSKGGEVDGPGTETSDSIPIRVSDGEFVVRASSAKIPQVRRILEILNIIGEPDTRPKKSKGKGPKKFAWGGQAIRGYEEGGSVGSFGASPGWGGAGSSGFGSEGGSGGDFGGGDFGGGFSEGYDWSSQDAAGNSYNNFGGNDMPGNKDHQCPPGYKWDEAKQACVEDKKKKEGGGGGGGLQAQAMALQARVDRDLSPGQFIPSNYGVPDMMPVGQDFTGENQPTFWGRN